ncbi:sensor histidine kinase [Dyadobacter sp. CY323]|uniref:sensor histidine kinase n=1 Tax=Dyadobacter sp. CY323 TaxID=2907302 RepID=UPI001F38ED90|nr:histidine kinase [Dyadobacter sp. CY323]MCE6991124.1 histidine kinase [Dyadobacter sp. CY323]
MNRIKKVFTAVHVILWILLSLLVGFQLSGEDNPNWLSSSASFILTGLYVFYTHFFLLTRFLGKRRKAAYFLRLAGIGLTAPLIFLFFHYKTLSASHSAFEYYMMALISIVPIFLFLSWLARVTENLVLNTIRKEQLEKQAVEAELYYLKSQINPHFLFNTLNNIHTLVYKQAPAAPDAVMQLASLMRYMIYESNAPTVPLSREMDYLQDYVSLQQLRYKNSPVVQMEIAGETGGCTIAPLLFIHLLENAYKHSPARLEPGDIKICIQLKKDTLFLSIQNPVGNNQKNNLEESGGIGLPNVRKRLQLLYPDKHTLEITKSSDTFSLTLKIQGLRLPANETKAHLLHH